MKKTIEHYPQHYYLSDSSTPLSLNWLMCLVVSGLVKAKKYDWRDSNMALFGSDTEKQVKSK